MYLAWCSRIHLFIFPLKELFPLKGVTFKAKVWGKKSVLNNIEIFPFSGLSVKPAKEHIKVDLSTF